MNILKLLFFTVFIILGTLTLPAQQYSQSLEGIDKVRIETRSDITINTHDSNTLLIKTHDKKEAPERAKGLKLNNAWGPENTGVGFSISKKGSTLELFNLRNHLDKEVDVFLPSSINISIKTTTYGNIEISGFYGEIEIDSDHQADIMLKNISGPVVASTMAGDVTIIFQNFNEEKPTSVSTMSGAIDVALPNNVKIDLLAKSTIGNIYTDLEIAVPPKKGLKPVSSHQIKGKINSGGTKVSLSSSAGDIFIRKKQK